MGQNGEGLYFGVMYLNPQTQRYLVDVLKSLTIEKVQGRIVSYTDGSVNVEINVGGKQYGAISASESTAVIDAYYRMLKAYEADLRKFDKSVDGIVEEILNAESQLNKKTESNWQTLP